MSDQPIVSCIFFSVSSTDYDNEFLINKKNYKHSNTSVDPDKYILRWHFFQIQASYC